MKIRFFSLLITIWVATACEERASLETPAGAIPPQVGASVSTRPDSAVDLLEPRVPLAIAGDGRWNYVERASADFDGDGRNETAVLIADAELDARGEPIWDHGHRWQVYFEEADSTRTYVYARFLPNGKLEARLTVPDEEKMPALVLHELTPHAMGIYEVRYSGPQKAWAVRHLYRELDPRQGFTTPRR